MYSAYFAIRLYLSATLVPRGGLEPPRREALTPEASVSTNSTTEAYAADAVHIMRQWQSRQLLNAKILAKAG